MKKIFLFLFLLFCTNVLLANPTPFKNIIFLGDSLTDDGKLFNMLLHHVPKSPPYFKGRFSNGPTWAENLAKHFYENYYVSYKIYAVGGATALFHLPAFGFVASSTLEVQVDKYLSDNLTHDKSQTLAAIWIGSNDYLYYQNQNNFRLTTKIVNKTIHSAKRLLDHGIKYLMILNLPDSSLAPYSKKHGDRNTLHHLIVMNNEKLAFAVQQLREQYPGVKIIFVDIYSNLLGFMANPDVFNKKYNLHVTNLTDSCWTGGYFNDTFFSPQLLRQELKQSSIINNPLSNITLPTDVNQADIEGILGYIENTPEIKYVYGVGKLFDKGLKPCDHPDEYLFWDSMHPTEVVHRVIYNLVLEQMMGEFMNDKNLTKHS